VVEENNLSQLVAGLRRLLGDRAKGSRFIETVPRRGFRFVAPVGRAGAAAAPPRLAVLPFKPLLAEGRDEWLELGMADSLIARLSLLSSLTVLSIGSVRRYAGPDQDPLRAARALDASWVVDGTLQRLGGELRVSVRLLRAVDGTAAWSASIDARLTGVFQLQDQIGEQLARALAPVLHRAPGEASGMAEVGGTRSMEAYRWFLQGSGRMLLQRGDGLRDAISDFRQAVAVDAGYARAWIGLADAHRRAAFVGEVPPRQAYAEVDTAVRRALALAPDLGDAHATRAYQHAAFDFDWAAAEQAFRRALALNPNLPLGHFGLGQLQLILRGSVEGFAHLRRAGELDPLQPLFGALEASFLRVAGRHEQARARLARTLEIAPTMPLAHLVLAQSHFEAGAQVAGLSALRHAVTLAGGAPVFDGLLGHYLARHGERAEARAILDRLEARARSAFVPATSMAVVCSGLGETARALEALELALQQRDSRIAFIKDAPYWDDLRRQPRFQALLQRLRLDGHGPGLWNP
jgi:TolB-like protein/Tfp pilus assembly protein PilF